MRAAIINPMSASGRTAHRWRAIINELQARSGEPIEAQLTHAPGDAITITRKLLTDGCHDFIVLGGDGTIGEVVAGCVDPSKSKPLRDNIELAIIHQGTGGDFARGMQIPKDESSAISTAIDGQLKRIDIGVATFAPIADITPLADKIADTTYMRSFACVANIGMGADVVEKVTGRLKRLGKNLSFALATLDSLARNKARHVQLALNQDTATKLNIVDIDVCNNKFMGGGMLIAPNALIDDGKFDVVTINASKRLRLISAFPKIYSGKHITHPLVRVTQANHVTIEAIDQNNQQRVVLDGELVGSTPAEFKTIPLAISVRVPRSYE